MGISHDIKPRKVYYPGRHNSVRNPKSNSEILESTKNTEVKVEDLPDFEKLEEKNEKAITPTQADERNNLEKIENEFFENYNSENEEDKKAQPQERIRIIRLSPGKIIAAMFLVLIAILISQNFSAIKGIFIPQKKTVSSQAKSQPQKVAQYTSEEKEQTGNKNENSNTQSENETKSIIADNTNTNASNANNNTNTNTTNTNATTINKSSIALKVLNGNGISGTAASVTSTLQNAGFTVLSTTNAKSFTYQNTYIYYKTGKENEANLVKDAIKDRILTVEKSDSAVSGVDVVVVVGKK